MKHNTLNYWGGDEGAESSEELDETLNAGQQGI